MKTKEQLEELQAIAILYLLHNENRLDDNIYHALNVVADLLCFIIDHDCEEAEEVKQRFDFMRKELEANGLNIKDCVIYVNKREAQDKIRENAKFN